MHLTDEEKRMLNGEFGPGVRRAMTLLTKYGEVFGAERLVPVSSVHMVPLDPYDWLLEMAEGVSQVRTVVSMNPYFLDPNRWREMGIPERYGERQVAAFHDRMNIYLKMGMFPTLTCAPYAVGFAAKQGTFISWAASSGQTLSNSLFAARTDRTGGPTAMAAATTGKTPYLGLLVSENRYGRVVAEPEGLDLDNFTLADYGAFSYYVGGIAADRNVVLNGLPRGLTTEQCKFLCSPLPVSGSVAMCHIVGTTPEAPTLEAALGNKKPEERIKVGKKELAQAYKSLTSAENDHLDLVGFGCPHCTIFEIRDIAKLLDGKKISSNVRLWVSTASAIRTLAERAGFVDTIEKAGGLVLADACALGAGSPFVYSGLGPTVIATDSARGAHYLPRTTGGRAKVHYGSVKACIESAIAGRWIGG